jgi:hypothetical protein
MADTYARMRQLVGTGDDWAAYNITLGSGELGVEIVSASDIRIKCGDGLTAWSGLPYTGLSLLATKANLSGGNVFYGNQIVSGSVFRIDGATGDTFAGVIVSTPGASGSVFRGSYYNTHNENNIAVAGFEQYVNTNGSAYIGASVTPPGGRSTDRRRSLFAGEAGATSGTVRLAGSGGYADTEGRIDFVADSDTATRESFINIRHRSSAASTNWYVGFTYNNTPIGAIVQSGTTGVAYNTSSDYRLKYDLVPMAGGIAKVMALKSYTGKWIADGAPFQGFLAHELQAVIPDAVTGAKDAVDANGDPKYQGVDLSRVVPTLVACAQEQQALITAQQAQIAALTARVEALEAA